MGWLLRRLLMALFAMAVGGLAGFGLLGRSGTTIGLIVGGLIGAAGLALFERRRGEQLLTWLRQSHAGPAPRDAGFWGELGYRFERALRQSELENRNERARLSQFLSAIEASPNGVMLLDAQDQIEWLNSSAADHFGLDPLRDRRQRVTNLVRAPAFVAYLQAAVRASVFRSCRCGHAALSGWRAAMPTALTVLSTDRTEEERTEDAADLSSTWHEIVRRSGCGLPETLSISAERRRRKRVLAMMTRQTERMGTLVHDLLTLAQLEGSPRPAADRWVDMKPLLGVVEADARALSAGRHRIAVDVPERTAIAGLATERRGHQPRQQRAPPYHRKAVRYVSGRIDAGRTQTGEMASATPPRIRANTGRAGPTLLRVDRQPSRGRRHGASCRA